MWNFIPYGAGTATFVRCVWCGDLHSDSLSVMKHMLWSTHSPVTVSGVEMIQHNKWQIYPLLPLNLNQPTISITYHPFILHFPVLFLTSLRQVLFLLASVQTQLPCKHLHIHTHIQSLWITHQIMQLIWLC